MFGKLLGSDGDADDEPVTNTHGTEFAVDISDPDERIFSDDGKEIAIKVDGETYAGEHLREEIETAIEEHDAIPVGYQAPEEGQLDIGRIPLKKLYVHLAVVATTGAGKSNLVQRIMDALMHADEGLAYIEPKGDGDAIEVAQRVPEHRIDDLIWVEPGSRDFEYVVALNLIGAPDADDPNELSEAIGRCIAATKSLFDTAEYWGPNMEFITDTMTHAMMAAPTEYALIDMPFILWREEELREFAESTDDFFLREKVLDLCEWDDDEKRPVWKRMAKHAADPTKRRMIAERESTISFEEIIEEKKIVVMKMPDAGGDVSELQALIWLSRFWEAQRQRAKRVDGKPSPYHVFVDESNKVLSPSVDVEDMLARSRSAQLSITLIAQYPDQWDDSTKEAAHYNTNTKLPLKSEGKDGARFMLEGFSELDASDVTGLDEHEVCANLPLKNGGSSEHILDTIPPMPELRTKEEAREAIRENLRREYGKKPPTDQEIIDNLQVGGLEEYRSMVNEGGEDGAVDLTGSDADILLAEAFEQLVDAGDDAETIPMEVLIDALSDRLAIDGQAVDTQVHRAISQDLLWTNNTVSEVGFTKKGMKRLWDSGTSVNTGGVTHQGALRAIARKLGEMGYDWHVPLQSGDEMPDLFAACPVDTSQGQTKAETDELYETLQSDHPRVLATSGEQDAAIEFESATLDAPAQVGHNLRKAFEKGDHVIYVVAEGDDRVSGKARKLAATLAEPMLTRVPSRTPNDVVARYLHQDTVCRAGDGTGAPLAAIPGDVTVQWVRDEESLLVLRDGDHTEYARFDTFDDWKTRSSSDYPATFAKNDGSVTVREGGDVTNYDDMETLREDYTLVYSPYLPIEEFGGELPEEGEDYTIAVLADDDDLPLQRYDPVDESLSPLGEEQTTRPDPAESSSGDSLSESVL